MEPVHVLLVTAPGCHYCDDALRTLHALQETYPLTVDLVPLASDTGRKLVIEHRVPFPPILLIEGSFFGYGRISPRQLEKRLADLVPIARPSSTPPPGPPVSGGPVKLS